MRRASHTDICGRPLVIKNRLYPDLPEELFSGRLFFSNAFRHHAELRRALRASHFAGQRASIFIVF
jgi:hypothetical protein